MKYGRLINGKYIDICEDYSAHSPEIRAEFVEIPADYAEESVVVDTFPLNKQTKLTQLNTWHDAQTSGMKAKYSHSEVESFLDKRNEAMAFRSDPLAPTPYVDAMSGGNNEIRLMLLNSILAKVDATAQLEAFVLFKRDEIEACVTQEELDLVTF